MRRFTAVIILLFAASACQLLTAAAEPGSPRTLVLIGDEGVRETHSQLLSSFEALGAQLDVRRSSNSSLQLRHWDTWLYGNVVLLHPNATGPTPGRSPCARRHAAAISHRIAAPATALQQPATALLSMPASECVCWVRL